MKPVHALIACSLLGTVWLASCSSDTKKKVLFPDGGAGEAGEPSGGSPAKGGTGGAPSGGTAPSAGTAPVPDASVGGDAAAGGQGGQVSEGGAPPICFSDFSNLAAGAPPVDVSVAGAAGAGGAEHLVFSCSTLLADLKPQFDPTTNQVTLDASLLGPVVSGTFSFYDDSYDADAGVYSTTCGDAAVQVNGTQMVLPVTPAAGTQTLKVPLVTLRDQCGNDANTSTPPDQAGDCFNLTFTPGASPTDTWTVDCLEGNCYPTCASQPPP